MNVGLLAMCVLSLLPVGLMPRWASVNQGYWYARSREFLSDPTLQTFRWLLVPGDTLFALGAFALVIFVLRLRNAPDAEPSPRKENEGTTSAPG